MPRDRIKVWVQTFKGRTNLYLQWIDPDTGQRKTVTSGESDPKKAERKRSDKEYELNHGLHKDRVRLDWPEFRRRFEDEYLAGLRPRSREKYGTVLDVFEQIVRPERLREVNERTIALFVKGMRARKVAGRSVPGMQPVTIKNYLVALRTALTYAVGQKLLPEVPEFPKIKVPKKKPQPIPAESFERMLAKAPDAHWRSYLLCGWWGGMRLSEARFLQWEPADQFPWLDLDNNRIVLPATFAKSDEDQWVPLHPVLRECLDGLPRTDRRVFPFRSQKTGDYLSRGAISHKVLRIAKAAAVNLSMHKLRKGFGCRVAKLLGKGNAPILHELMRHSSMQITMDYYASVDDVLQEAIKDLQ